MIENTYTVIEESISAIREQTASTCTFYNVTMTTKNTEYSQVLPDGCKSFYIGIRGGVATDLLRIAFVTGKVAGPTAPYNQITGESDWGNKDVYLDGKTLFFAYSEDGKVAQIEAWT